MLIFTNKKRNNKKALIFTIDAILATVISIIVILMGYYYLSHSFVDANEDNDLYLFSLSSLTVLEKDGTLETIISSSNESHLEQFLDHTPNQICGVITVYKYPNQEIHQKLKSGCDPKNESISIIRSFIYEKAIYYAKLESWYQ